MASPNCLASVIKGKELQHEEITITSRQNTHGSDRMSADNAGGFSLLKVIRFSLRQLSNSAPTSVSTTQDDEVEVGLTPNQQRRINGGDTHKPSMAAGSLETQAHAALDSW